MESEPEEKQSAVKLDSLALAAKSAADEVAKKTDRWWMGFLILVGMGFATLILWWHREDQRAMAVLFRETLHANTIALTQVAVAVDKMERRTP